MIDQLNVKAEAKLKTLFRRRPLGVKLNENIHLMIIVLFFDESYPYGLCHSKNVSNRAVTWSPTKIKDQVVQENGWRKAPNEGPVGFGAVRTT